ncbi:hypothetical protein GOX2532 (plasmid) [Gluconobacter oxydans 621H]|uniref:DUF3085 domain-containing protein n=2 Tax=Gluconobacter oxydans TaxID=442 RepID=Q5HY05_GLUOX|nr:hypothetical protein GOX2532 [Gluconobacter oxydans 621H]
MTATGVTFHADFPADPSGHQGRCRTGRWGLRFSRPGLRLYVPAELSGGPGAPSLSRFRLPHDPRSGLKLPRLRTPPRPAIVRGFSFLIRGKYPMIVTFDRALIERLLAHAEAASERRATLTQLFDKSLRKPGHGAREWGRPEDIDPAKIPAGLWLIGDHGIYMMSNGLPLLPSDDGQKPNLCAYAREADPAQNAGRAHDVKRQAFGGDDGCEFLEAALVRRALSKVSGDTLRLNITPETLEILA